MDEFIKMAKKSKNISIHFLIIIITGFPKESSGSANFLFREKTIPKMAISEY